MGMKKENVLGMMAMMAAMSESSHIVNTTDNNEFKEPKPIKKIIPKGLKEFIYGEESIYALNQKNADRKAKKLGLI